jgi:hypothetical protein
MAPVHLNTTADHGERPIWIVSEEAGPVDEWPSRVWVTAKAGLDGTRLGELGKCI